VSKDPEADAMINQALGASPTAAYVLVQHAILSDQALHAAQQQIADLQAQLRQQQPYQPAPQSAGFFPQQPAPQPGPWSAPSPEPMPQPGFMGPGPFRSGGGLGSFLRSAGTTAAGVAGGALLFEGVSSLFGGHHGFGGGGFGGGFGGAPVENITNNYYDDDGRGDDRRDGGHFADGNSDSSVFDNSMLDDPSFGPNGSDDF
jgi:hypothetical protein